MTVVSAGVDGELGSDDDLVVHDHADENGNYTVDGLPAGPTQVSYDPGDLPDGLDPSTISTAPTRPARS